MKDYTKGKTPEMLEPFFPNEIFRHIIVSCFIIIVELITVILIPLPVKLINKPDHIPWFLLPIYNLDKLIQNKTLFISLLVLCALLFISWPFLVSGKKYNLSSPNKEQVSNNIHVGYTKERNNLWQRPIPFMIVIIVIISVITLCFINT